MVETATNSRAHVIDSFRDGAISLTTEELAQFDEGVISSGVDTTEEDIDDILYR